MTPNKRIPLVYRRKLRRLKRKLDRMNELMWLMKGEINAMLYIQPKEEEPEALTVNNYGDKQQKLEGEEENV